ncbi:hypothetical protein BC832DRAFT_557172 [Gaertneriomyces semiglobifer]|nr:hypothetical protein BC832DRAFT_557172 [Gaertneriomyces semiglobifer]
MPLIDPNQLAAQLASVKENIKRQKDTPPSPLRLHSAFSQAQGGLLKSLAHARWSKENENRPSGSHEFLQTYSGEEKHVSHADWKDLELVDIEDLWIRMIHRGRYILCRIATRPTLTVGLQMAVIAPSGAVLQLAVYNYPILPVALGRPTLRDIDAAFPLHSIIAIKEPFLKMAASGDTPMIRIDSPTDLKFVSPFDPLVKGIAWARDYPRQGIWVVPVPEKKPLDYWKNTGNAHFVKKQFFQAMKAYTDGIDEHITDPRVSLLFLNRAQARIHLQRYNAALHDAVTSLENAGCVRNDPLLYQKALLRKAKALYCLRRWKDAREAYKQLSDCFPNSVEGREGLSMTAKRMQELSGDFDMVSLYKCGLNPHARCDVADYVGPVTVSAIKPKGRGLVTTRDVVPGELLLGVKALSYVAPPADFTIMGLNLLTNQLDKITQLLTVSDLVYKLTDEPGLGERVYGLYAGPDQTTPETYDLNGRAAQDDVQAPVDVGRIERAVTFNAFAPESVRPAAFQPSSIPERDKPTALFCQTSLINHSCAYNASWMCFGDLQVIRALVPIPQGKEVTISYAVDGGYNERMKLLAGKHLTKCSCELCTADLHDGNVLINKRARLENDSLLPVTYSTPAPAVRRAIVERTKVVNLMAETYRAERSLRPELFSAYNRLSFAYGVLAVVEKNTRYYQEVIRYSEQSLACIGVTATVVSNKKKGKKAKNDLSNLPVSGTPRHHSHAAVCTALQIAAAHRAIRAAARAWVQAALYMESVTVAPGPAFFKCRYERMLSDLDLHAFL